jgi:hypothetical protein
MSVHAALLNYVLLHTCRSILMVSFGEKWLVPEDTIQSVEFLNCLLDTGR